MKRTKYILILLAGLFLTACRSKSNDDTKTAKKIDIFELDTIGTKPKQAKFKREKLIQIAAHDKFSIRDFKNMKFVWKGIRDIDKLDGIEYVRERNRKLDPFENDNTVAIMADYSDNIRPKSYGNKSVIIPVYFHSHEVYTIWEIEHDSFKFSKILKPIQNGRYSRSIIDSIFEVQGETVISGMTLGGEGGDTWNSFWVKQIKNDSIIKLEETPINYNLHLELQSYVLKYKYPKITRTIFRDSIYQFKDTIISNINVKELIETGL